MIDIMTYSSTYNFWFINICLDILIGTATIFAVLLLSACVVSLFKDKPPKESEYYQYCDYCGFKFKHKEMARHYREEHKRFY